MTDPRDSIIIIFAWTIAVLVTIVCVIVGFILFG